MRQEIEIIIERLETLDPTSPESHVMRDRCLAELGQLNPGAVELAEIDARLAAMAEKLRSEAARADREAEQLQRFHRAKCAQARNAANFGAEVTK
jgi:hypothetical protein